MSKPIGPNNPRQNPPLGNPRPLGPSGQQPVRTPSGATGPNPRQPAGSRETRSGAPGLDRPTIPGLDRPTTRRPSNTVTETRQTPREGFRVSSRLYGEPGPNERPNPLNIRESIGPNGERETIMIVGSSAFAPLPPKPNTLIPPAPIGAYQDSSALNLFNWMLWGLGEIFTQ